jgi:hypothetical protein
MNYVEAIVTLAPDANLTEVQAWFEQKGFQSVPMRMGMLISGDEDLFRRVFKATGDDINARAVRDISLPIPSEIASLIGSITIRRLPSTYA